jgi:putative transposase
MFISMRSASKFATKASCKTRAAISPWGSELTGAKRFSGCGLETTEGANFWLKVITELKNRGVQDVLIACCDGLNGFPQAVEAVFPKTVIQTCIGHLIRSSTRFVSYAQRKTVIADLRRVYAAATEDAALAVLDDFEAKWKDRYPVVGQTWRANWERVPPFFASRRTFGGSSTPQTRSNLNFQLRKVIKSNGHFPNEAATKLLYLALRNAQKKWRLAPRFWSVLNQFAIYFEGRLPA